MEESDKDQEEEESDQEQLGVFLTAPLFTSNLVRLQNASRRLGALLCMVFLRPRSLSNTMETENIISSSVLPESAKVTVKVSVAT